MHRAWNITARTGFSSALVLLLLAGCGRSIATVAREPAFVQAGRSAADREQLVRGPSFGNNAAADRRRGFFDFWNEQVIREDRAVSTVFMGDSITELWNLPVYFRSTGPLIENRGISGDLATHMAERFQADVLQLRPRNVVILAGTNDVGRLLEQKKGDDEIVENVTASVVSMIEQARKAGLNTFVCSILPTNSDYRRHGEKTWLRAKINERIKAACAEKGCIWVEYAAAMRDENGDLRRELARDGLHPHYAGYEIMARVLKETAAAHGIGL